MIQYFIEQDQGHIQLFFIEDLQPCLDIIPELFLVNWDIILLEAKRAAHTLIRKVTELLDR